MNSLLLLKVEVSSYTVLSAQYHSMGNDLIQIGSAPRQGGIGLEVSSAPRFVPIPATAGDGKAFYLETFGCQMNVHDSEKVAGVLMERGYRPVETHEAADIILYNTCSIREKAAQKVFSRLGTFRKAGASAQKIIGVLGCVAQQEGEKFFERAPQVSLVCGSASYPRLPDLLQQIESGNRRVMGLDLDTEDCFETEFTRRDNRFRAYLTIIEGCDQRCAFCVVPTTRGPERSRSGAKIVAECHRLVDAGYTEIQILGQIVNAWRDPSPAHWSFAELLSRVSEVSGLRRVRFTTSHPRYFTPDIVQAIDSHPVLCDQIHLPVQSGSTEVLARMLRGYSREEYLEKIHCIRKAQRAISLSTDIIVGFCGESAADFDQTVSLLTEVEYDQVFSFKFSPRPNTAALEFADTVAEEEKSRRLAVLQEVQRQIQVRRNEAMVGQTLEVLVEGYQPRLGQAVGRTTSNKVLNFPGEPADIGTYRQVRVKSSGPNSLVGERIAD
ncbi:MAG: tRNA (N6-isopentenyl adenosine(37)-C2)-methylthiotransferase MiaB [Acidobacteriota bacterium]|nr:tRNA (N6-isopentenyl adenosine(37)-C2)-methylthiotransferase MiaB [Acidobacteriota bacterium]